jgi:hypothetical protein
MKKNGLLERVSGIAGESEGYSRCHRNAHRRWWHDHFDTNATRGSNGDSRAYAGRRAYGDPTKDSDRRGWSVSGAFRFE